MKEGPIQAAVVKFARAAPFKMIAIKLSTAGRFGTTGLPDYEFLMKPVDLSKVSAKFRPDVFFIEFKATGEKSTPLQVEKQRQLRDQGFRVYADIDSIEWGKKIIEDEFNRRA